MANKNFLDTTGLTYFWNKIADKIAGIKPADIGALAAPATMTANKWLKTDANGAVILADLPNPTVITETTIQSIVDGSYIPTTES